ncbi:MAG: GRP family sugar transporter [Planctomycetia bacterium]|nr:GRP family sugar transporter [Planctomycetia bacterium]
MKTIFVGKTSNNVHSSAARTSRVFDRNARYLSDQVYGFVNCLIASTLYSLSLAMLRLMSNYQNVSPDWTLCFKESFLVLSSFLCIIWLHRRGKYRIPPLKIIFAIIIGAIFCEGIASRYHLLAYAMIGLALSSPLMQAFQIIGTTILGAFCYSEKISWMKMITIFILIVAVFFLSFGQEKAKELSKATTDNSAMKITDFDSSSVEKLSDSNILELNYLQNPGTNLATNSFEITNKKDDSVASYSISQEKSKKLSPFFWGILFALITGLGYTIHLMILRGILRTKIEFSSNNHSDQEWPEIKGIAPGKWRSRKNDSSKRLNLFDNQDRSRLWTVMFLLPLIGIFIFAGFLYAERDFAGFYDVPKACWIIVSISGIANMIGFFFQLESLRFVSGSIVSLVAVSQTLTLTLIGIGFFNESANAFIWLGIILTLLGIVLTGKTK